MIFTRRMLVAGGTSINDGVKLLGNARHPDIVADYARTFDVLRGLAADVFLAQHPAMYGMSEKMELLKAGARTNPFVDPEGYRRFVAGQENRYLEQLEKERSFDE